MQIKQVAFSDKLTSVTTDLSAAGGNPGEIYQNTDGKTYKLCLAGASIASIGSPCILQLDSVSGSTGYTVEPCAASQAPVFGFNKTGTSVAAGGYFWAQVGGPMAVDSAALAASVAANTPLALDSDKKINVIDTTAGSHAAQAFGHTCASIASDVAAGSGIIYLQCWGK